MFSTRLLVFSVVLLKLPAKGSESGYSIGGDEAECWQTSMGSTSASNASNCSCTTFSDDTLHLSSCPSDIRLEFLDDHHSIMYTRTEYAFRYKISTDFRPKKEQSYEVSHANIHSCSLNINPFCTPFLGPAEVSLVTHSNTISGNATYEDGAWVANFTSLVTMDDSFEGVHTIIAHVRVFTVDSNGVELKYDVARAQLNVLVKVLEIENVLGITNSQEIWIAIIYGLSIAICAVCLFTVIRYRTHKVMVYSSVKLLVFMTLCGMCAMTTAFAMRSNPTSHCSDYLIGSVLPWAAMYLTLFNKVFRVWYILRKQGKIKKRVMTEQFQFMLLFSQIAVFAGFLLLWRYLSPQDETCTGEHEEAFMRTYYLLMCIMFGCGLYMAIQTKKFTTVFNESKIIAFAIYNCVLLFPALEMSIGYVEDDLGVIWVLQVLFMCISVVTTVCTIIYPKLQLIMSKAEISLTKKHARQTAINLGQKVPDELMELVIKLKEELDGVVNSHYADIEISPEQLQLVRSRCKGITTTMDMQSSLSPKGNEVRSARKHSHENSGPSTRRSYWGKLFSSIQQGHLKAEKDSEEQGMEIPQLNVLAEASEQEPSSQALEATQAHHQV